jgi:hypothetical protein
MTTEIRLTQVKGVPELTSADVNKALVYKGSNTFAFESLNTSEIATLQTQVTSLDTRVDALEAAAITSVDGGEY